MSTDRIALAFGGLRERGEKGLIPFVTAGYPDLETTERLVLGMAESGADLIELGVPFSDPLADGPVIQHASQIALTRGTNLARILELVARLRKRTAIPLVLMSYYNPILSYGPETLIAKAAGVGIDGLIIPDLPVEEAGDILALSDTLGVALIPLVAPTSGARRIAFIAERARGFVYCVSLTGVTGSGGRYSDQLTTMLDTVRAHTDLPAAIGFGIAEPGQARNLAPRADALIVGSAFVKRITEAGVNQAVAAAQELVQSLKRALAEK
ncbi:MAG: tryptophan synthase subunit alpha [Candidatus Desulforudis sp.]|nr:tryptophan synthase subunit alpha [Desulforudis sp.]